MDILCGEEKPMELSLSDNSFYFDSVYSNHWQPAALAGYEMTCWRLINLSSFLFFLFVLLHEHW